MPPEKPGCFLNPHSLPVSHRLQHAEPAAALRHIRQLPDYQPTPLHALPALARALGIGNLLLKDESQRFGLGAFKALGALYACQLLTQKSACQPSQNRAGEEPPPANITFVAATDGNHGRAVACAARRLGCDACIYMPRETPTARRQAIAQEGATVELVAGGYNDAISRARTHAESAECILVQDLAWPGYEQIPGWIVDGYETLFAELPQQCEAAGISSIDVVLLQGGVGSFAGAGVRWFNRMQAPGPKLIVVEPLAAACLQASARQPEGQAGTLADTGKTIMHCLNCETPSSITWPDLRTSVDLFIAVTDRLAIDAMRQLAQPLGTDPRIISGESGAAGLAGLLALLREPACRCAADSLQLPNHPTVLLINTEGAIDTDSWTALTGLSL